MYHVFRIQNPTPFHTVRHRRRYLAHLCASRYIFVRCTTSLRKNIQQSIDSEVSNTFIEVSCLVHFHFFLKTKQTTEILNNMFAKLCFVVEMHISEKLLIRIYACKSMIYYSKNFSIDLG